MRGPRARRPGGHPLAGRPTRSGHRGSGPPRERVRPAPSGRCRSGASSPATHARSLASGGSRARTSVHWLDVEARPMRHLLALAVLVAALCSCAADEGSASPRVSPTASPDVCTGTDVQLVDILPMSPEQRLDCFGGRSITFVAYVSGMVGAGTCTFSPIPGDGWLNMCGGPSRILVATPGDEEGLGAYLPPTIDRQDIPMDTWIVATGHFDDPAAATCDREGHTGPARDPEHVEMCRMAFVLEEAAPER